MRWSTRVAAVLALTLAVGVGVTEPASAHQQSPHTVTVNGTLTLRDYDSPDADEVCTRNVFLSDVAQLPRDGQVTISWTPSCDEARLKIRANGTLDSAGRVAVSGSFRLEEQDCYLIGCDWDHVDTTTFSFTLAPLGTRRVTATIDDGDQARASVDVTFANSF